MPAPTDGWMEELDGPAGVVPVRFVLHPTVAEAPGHAHLLRHTQLVVVGRATPGHAPAVERRAVRETRPEALAAVLRLLIGALEEAGLAVPSDGLTRGLLRHLEREARFASLAREGVEAPGLGIGPRHPAADPAPWVRIGLPTPEED